MPCFLLLSECFHRFENHISVPIVRLAGRYPGYIRLFDLLPQGRVSLLPGEDTVYNALNLVTAYR